MAPARNDLITEMKKHRWYHKIHLGDGVFTTGRDGPGRLENMDFPHDLTDMSVLDIGAWDGYFSFEAERRGASYVLATDWEVWTGARHGLDTQLPVKAPFEFARKALQSSVADKTISVYDISPEQVGSFDLVLFLGVLYHLWHPLLALERLSSVNSKAMILETAVDAWEEKEPLMIFHKDAVEGDPTNWWYPNPACVIDMLKAVGYQKVIEIPRPNSLSPHRRVFHAFKDAHGGWEV